MMAFSGLIDRHSRSCISATGTLYEIAIILAESGVVKGIRAAKSFFFEHDEHSWKAFLRSQKHHNWGLFQV